MSQKQRDKQRRREARKQKSHRPGLSPAQRQAAYVRNSDGDTWLSLKPKPQPRPIPQTRPPLLFAVVSTGTIWCSLRH